MDKPTIGSTVIIRTDYSKYKNHFASYVTRTYEHVGVVVESQPWEKDSTITIITNDKKFPIRSIDVSNVVSIDTIDNIKTINVENYKKEMSKPAKTYQIKGSKGNFYIVTKDKNSWNCNCMAGLRGRYCKHIAEAKELNSD